MEIKSLADFEKCLKDISECVDKLSKLQAIPYNSSLYGYLSSAGFSLGMALSDSNQLNEELL